MAPVPYRTPEEPLPEVPSFVVQELFDEGEKEVSGAEAESAHLVPRAPKHVKKAPLPHAPKEKEMPQRWRRP